jgi:hypothetical protein
VRLEVLDCAWKANVNPSPVKASLLASARQEIADHSLKEQAASEAEAISRLRDRKGRMRSKRIFALAMASSR